MWLVVSSDTLVYQKLVKYNYQEYFILYYRRRNTVYKVYDTSSEITNEENTYIHVYSSTLYSPRKCFFLEVGSQEAT